ncbi:MAG: hypothetical protein ACR2RE_30385 [Geminicoccaceae bacterium]
MSKPILCLDFDGVIHSYESGWKGADVIPDPPVEGALPFLYMALACFRVAIFSSRSNQPGGIKAMKKWLRKHERCHDDEALWHAGWLNEIEFPLEKPPAKVTIDDRALTFTGEWPTMEALMAFKPWNKP